MISFRPKSFVSSGSYPSVCRDDLEFCFECTPGIVLEHAVLNAMLEVTDAGDRSDLVARLSQKFGMTNVLYAIGACEASHYLVEREGQMRLPREGYLRLQRIAQASVRARQRHEKARKAQSRRSYINVIDPEFWTEMVRRRGLTATGYELRPRDAVLAMLSALHTFDDEFREDIATLGMCFSSPWSSRDRLAQDLDGLARKYELKFDWFRHYVRTTAERVGRGGSDSLVLPSAGLAEDLLLGARAHRSRTDQRRKKIGQDYAPVIELMAETWHADSYDCLDPIVVKRAVRSLQVLFKEFDEQFLARQDEVARGQGISLVPRSVR